MCAAQNSPLQHTGFRPRAAHDVVRLGASSFQLAGHEEHLNTADGYVVCLFDSNKFYDLIQQS